MRIVVTVLGLLPIITIGACTSSSDPAEVIGGDGDGSAKQDGDSSMDADTTSDGGADAQRDGTQDSGPGSSKKIFVTSLEYTGDLGGTSGADDKCAARAVVANLPGSYKAWISTTGSDDAKSRLVHSTGAYVRMDGMLVAAGWEKLASNAHEAAIDIDEKGNKVAASTSVWTNTKPDGSSKGTEHCLNWLSPSNGQIGTYGIVDAKDARWTDAAIGSCEPKARLYCVEQ